MCTMAINDCVTAIRGIATLRDLRTLRWLTTVLERRSGWAYEPRVPRLAGMSWRAVRHPGGVAECLAECLLYGGSHEPGQIDPTSSLYCLSIISNSISNPAFFLVILHRQGFSLLFSLSLFFSFLFFFVFRIQLSSSLSSNFSFIQAPTDDHYSCQVPLPCATAGKVPGRP